MIGMDSEPFDGWWWMPDHPDNTRFGRLSAGTAA
jgi:hypothetical protein